MCGCGLEVGHREVRIRRGLEPDELDALGRRAGLVELDVAQPPAGERLEGDTGAEVTPLGERDRVAGLEHREHERGRRAAAGGKEQCPAAVELAEAFLGLGDGRAAVPGVIELSGLAPLVVRPDRRAVDGLHAVEPTQAPLGAPRGVPCGRARGRASSTRRRSRPSPRRPPRRRSLCRRATPRGRTRTRRARSTR